MENRERKNEARSKADFIREEKMFTLKLIKGVLTRSSRLKFLCISVILLSTLYFTYLFRHSSFLLFILVLLILQKLFQMYLSNNTHHHSMLTPNFTKGQLPLQWTRGWKYIECCHWYKLRWTNKNSRTPPVVIRWREEWNYAYHLKGILGYPLSQNNYVLRKLYNVGHYMYVQSNVELLEECK